jgi:hypothetical protein
MSILAGPVFAVALVMGVAGVLKLARPRTAARAMRAAGLPASPLAVRALAVTEIVVAAAALAFGTALTAAAMAVYYAGFAVFATVLIRRAGSTAPCGCFGEAKADEATTWVHVGMNVAAAILCLAAVVWPTGGIGDVMAGQPLAGIPFAVLTVLCAWLWYLALTVVPALVAATRRPATDRVASTS